MTASSTDTRSSMGACPPLEEIAAFLDGWLSPEDRERIMAHLASCESCYEVFAGAVHFQEDEGTVVDNDKKGDLPVPFVSEPDKTNPRAHPPQRASWWLALAASVLIAPALVFLVWREFRAPTALGIADLVKPVEENAAVSRLIYKSKTYRDAGETKDLVGERSAFMSGVYLLDLRLSLKDPNLKSTALVIQDLADALQNTSVLGSLGDDYEAQQAGLKSLADLNRFEAWNSKKEAEIEQYMLYSDNFQFGKWAEAGRLAAGTESPGFFDDRNNRRFLDRLLKETPWAGDDLLDEVPNHLEAIQETWDSGKPTREDYQTLATHFENIIRAYDTSDEL